MITSPVKDHSYELTRLGPAVREYISFKRTEDGLSESTLDSYERVLARFAVRHATKGPTEITLTDLRAERDSHPLLSRRRVTSALRNFSEWLYLEGHAPEFAGGRLKAPKVPRPPITDLYNDVDKARVVAAQETIRDRVGVLLLLRAGLRKAELSNLRVRDINLALRVVTVVHGKGSKSRMIPIRGSVVQALDEYLMTPMPGWERPPRPAEFLLYPMHQGNQGATGKANPTKQMSSSGAHIWWYKCLERAGFVEKGTRRGRRMHATRHTYATDLGRASGWNIVAVSKTLGHANIATTIDTYTQFMLSDQEAAVDLLPDIEAVPE